MNRRLIGAAGVAIGLALTSTASAQMVVTGQNRFIEGSTHSMFPDGSTNDFGPDRTEAFPGDFGQWVGVLTAPGLITASGTQDGGWDGANTITLTTFQTSYNGGGPPGSSASSTLQSVFEYTFDITEPATFTLNTSIACSLDVVLRLTLTGPGGTSIIDATATPNGPPLEFINHTGSLTTGSHTLRLDASGTISFVAGPNGGGNGGGVGGPQPALTFSVAPAPSCPADFNGSGSVTVQDIFDFLAAYFSNDPTADFNGVGGITVQDIFDYLAAYFTGCT